MSMLFFCIVFILMFLGVPVFFALASAPTIEVFLRGLDHRILQTLFSRLVNGTESFPLLALPFFILAGAVMGKGGITKQIIYFSQAMMGHKKGSLGHIVVLSSTIFSSLTGSAIAATSGVGSMLIPEMKKKGFSTEYAAGITAAATVLGPIIPPSGIMLIYAFIMKTSVGDMFIGAIIPGLLFMVSLMIINYILCSIKKFTFTTPKTSIKERLIAFKEAFWALLTPIIILGGIYGGIFTPTEAAAIASSYAIIICIFVLRTIKFLDLIEIFKEVVISTGSILVLVGISAGFASIVQQSPVAVFMSNFVSTISNPYLLFFIINVLLFIIGMFLDAGPAIFIFAPIFAPPLIAMGVDPLHFGVIMSINVTIGLATPPMGLVLFVASDISKISFEKIALAAFPFIIMEIILVFVITYIPNLVLWLPRTMS